MISLQNNSKDTVEVLFELGGLIDKIEDENRYEEIKNTLDDYLRMFEHPGVGEDAIIGMIKHFAAPTYRKVWEVSRFDVQVVMLGVSIESWLNEVLSKYDDRQKEQWLRDRAVEGYSDWHRHVQSKVDVYGITTEQSTNTEADGRKSPAPTADSKGTGESRESAPSIPTLSRSTQ